jgi:acyl-CoA thioesterase FadM
LWSTGFRKNGHCYSFEFNEINVKNKWGPLTTFNTIRFRYPLKVFQKYQLKTRIVWWDDVTFYYKQVFERKGRVVASGYVYTTFIGPNGAVPPSEVLAELGLSLTKPNESEIVFKLREIESLIHESQKE